MKLKPQTQAVLDLLRSTPEGITPIEALREVGTFRLSARVLELRRAGYPITSKSAGDGVWIYRLEPGLTDACGNPYPVILEPVA